MFSPAIQYMENINQAQRRGRWERWDTSGNIKSVIVIVKVQREK